MSDISSTPVDGQMDLCPGTPYQFGLFLQVRDYETDAQGIVNNANYLHYLEHTRHMFCKWRGMSFADMLEERIIAVLNRLEIEYRSSLCGGDLAKSCLWVERKGPRFIFHQDIFRWPDTINPVTSAVATIVAKRDGMVLRGNELADILL
ncbi:MAG: acyl-CoA thioesterase [Muribaculaceae bacterium]|jgi:Predicted thioesterase|nr:acyl-CoA thioesterase [Muribaculaceae bacterium]